MKDTYLYHDRWERDSLSLNLTGQRLCVNVAYTCIFALISVSQRGYFFNSTFLKLMVYCFHCGVIWSFFFQQKRQAFHRGPTTKAEAIIRRLQMGQALTESELRWSNTKVPVWHFTGYNDIFHWDGTCQAVIRPSRIAPNGCSFVIVQSCCWTWFRARPRR